jgi:cysteine synthase
MKAQNILELVGNTPMVKVNCLNPNLRLEMWLKLEMFNPGDLSKIE